MVPSRGAPNAENLKCSEKLHIKNSKTEINELLEKVEIIKNELNAEKARQIYDNIHLENSRGSSTKLWCGN